MKKAIRAVLVLLAACSGSEPSAPSGSTPTDTFQPVVGQWCEEETATVTRDGPDATVTLKVNRTTIREVTDANGFRREQEVRSCSTVTCSILGGASMSDGELINFCRSR